MIDPAHDLPVVRQAKALNISRGSVYYQPRPVSAQDLALQRRIDELHLEYPFAGARMLRDMLFREGLSIGRRHIRTLMKRMGIEALYRRPNTSKPSPGHKIYPYFLRGVKVWRANQAWATDNRLLGIGGSWTEAFTYDATGNMLSHSSPFADFRYDYHARIYNVSHDFTA